MNLRALSVASLSASCLFAAASQAGAQAPGAEPFPPAGAGGDAAGAPFERMLENGVACGRAFEVSSLSGMDCFSGELGGFLVGAAARLAERSGRELFGPRFHVVQRLSWSPFGEGLSGNLDAVLPLAFLSGADAIEAGEETRAVFLQQGVTRWRDARGFRRNDARFGAAYRFSLSHEPGGDILGVQAVVQENLERGHRRFVAGLDYAGRWGVSSLQQFVPATGWRPGRRGYEERPRGGTKLGLRLDATTTLSVETSLARWDEDGTGQSVTDGRVALGWRPHPWLSLEAGLAGIGEAEEQGALRFAVRVPLGGGANGRAPKWGGLGVAGGSQAPADLWRPIENVERLEIVERVMTPEQLLRTGAIEARFLQDSAATGAEIGVEVSIPAPLPDDLRLELRLEPGDGDNPAVAGEDFVDEPVAVAIPAGSTAAQVSIRLLRNAGLQSGRSLSVAVSLAA